MTAEPTNPIQKRLRQLKLRQLDLIERTGLDKSTISLYVNGHRLPSLRQAWEIARALKCGLADVWPYPYVKALDDRTIDERTGVKHDNSNRKSPDTEAIDRTES